MSFHHTHPNLARYVQSKNAWRRLMKEVPFDLNFLTLADKKRLQEHLEGDLSPENLCCDGELQGEDLALKTDYLLAVKRELASYA